MTCYYHPGVIRVISHWIKVSERVGISYVSNRLQCDYVRSANARSHGGPSGRVYNKDGINNILQDDGSFDTRTMWQRVREKGSPRTMDDER